jgi:general secretion pathway protein I
LFRAIPCERRHRTAGFTILEVLVALAVVAAVLAAIGAVIATSVRGTRSLEQHVALVQTARSIVTGLPKRTELTPGQLSGEFAGHRWQVDVAPFSGSGDPAASVWVPQTVAVTVRSPSGGLLRVDTVRLLRRSGA